MPWDHIFHFHQVIGIMIVIGTMFHASLQTLNYIAVSDISGPDSVWTPGLFGLTQEFITG